MPMNRESVKRGSLLPTENYVVEADFFYTGYS
jgi:hypothetical protein